MPWEIVKERGQYCVEKEGGEVVPGGCHPTRAEAEAQLRALYASERTAAVEPEPKAAGVALVAADTGRVLMIQRAMIDGEDACGKWEFPGGKLDPGEAPMAGAMREFAEETGHPVPEPWIDAATWLSANGVYQGFVLLVPGEADFPLDATDPEHREVADPDNPGGGNYTEAVAWFDPWDLDRGPRILREECRATPWKLIKDAGPGRGGVQTMVASADEKTVRELRARAELAGFQLVQLPEEPPADMDSLVASLGPVPVEHLVPGFELEGPTPYRVSDDRASADGHLALWTSCHIGFPGCVTPPREESFDFYNLTPALLSDGRTVGVGRVTVGTGHAGPDLSWRTAAAHYDNSGTCVGIAHAVPDRWGIRLPTHIVASGERVDELARSPLSGDWRRVAGGRSPLRLVASLGVNVPGYPVPQALVASGEVVSMQVGFDLEDAALVASAADEIAIGVGLDPASRAAAIRAGLLG